MEPILSTILDKLADIETAMDDDDTKHNVNAMLDDIYDFVCIEVLEAQRTAWLKATGILP
tara:strand:+ start:307 stop:486 length:180 start_codon:yes stop_codon:yes gene_type:complete